MPAIEERTSKTTAAACAHRSCEGCEIQGKLLCIHTPSDVADFGVVAVGWGIPFVAGMVTGKHWTGLAVWIGLAALFFGYVEARLLCRHCPHYAEEGFTLKCHANWGFPKIPQYDPRPMNSVEGMIFLAFVAILFLYHIPFFIIGRQWLLLAVTTWALVAWVWTVQRTQCTRCYHLSCPGNRVPEDVRKGFFKNYPTFAAAWKQKEEPDTVPRS